jgi:DNA-damage-inducible protein D
MLNSGGFFFFNCGDIQNFTGGLYMNENQISRKDYISFEKIRRSDDAGSEYWSARDLQPILEYESWDKFRRVIEKAMVACEQSGHSIDDHFSHMGKMVKIGSGASREIADYQLSRYACYLVVQNGDPSKSVIANGQTYFAMQTRRQELAGEKSFQRLKEDEKRLFLRNELKEHNKQLVEAAQQAGVVSTLDFAVFQNHGYKGLYGGLDAKAIHNRKELKKSQKILDHMGSTELAANLFRATQTEEKLRREDIQGKNKANTTHFKVGNKVRQTIKELGGTMPEDLPTPKKSIAQVGRKKRKKLKNK